MDQTQLAPASAPATPRDGSQTANWFAAAPDDAFDTLFPQTEGIIPDQSQAAPPAEQTPAPAPQAQPPDEPFLKAPSGTVYKTRDEAIKGIETKDATIQQLRERIAAREGVDPLTGRPVAPPPQAPVNYLQNQDAYFTALHNAVERGDKSAYLQAQVKLVQDILQPYVPVVVGAAKDRALNSVPEPIRKFVGTPEYQDALRNSPVLQNAIQSAEQNPEWASQLPEFYSLAYAQYVATQLPKSAAPAQPNSNPSPRPPTAPGTLTPPTQPAAQPSLATSEGRKAIIERGLASGTADMVW
jgi:hypothetical protein